MPAIRYKTPVKDAADLPTSIFDKIVGDPKPVVTGAQGNQFYAAVSTGGDGKFGGVTVDSGMLAMHAPKRHWYNNQSDFNEFALDRMVKKLTAAGSTPVPSNTLAAVLDQIKAKL